MSNNKNLDLYLDLYSKYIDARVSVHNYHIRFSNYVGQESYYRLREHVRQLPALEKEMLKAARAAVQEQKEIDKAAKIADRLNRRKKKRIKNDV